MSELTINRLRRANKKIAKLEADVVSLQLIEKNLLQYCKDHKARNAELEAEVKRLSSSHYRAGGDKV